MIDYKNDLTSFCEDFIFPQFSSGRGSRVEKLPGGAVWNPYELEVMNRRNNENKFPNYNITSKYELNFDVDFNIEDQYIKMISQEMSKSIDEEIMKALMGGTTPASLLSSYKYEDIVNVVMCDSPLVSPEYENTVNVLMDETPVSINHGSTGCTTLTGNWLVCSDRNALLNSINGNPEKQDSKYSDYERAMSIVKEK